LRIYIVLLNFLIIFVMKKMNFEQMEVIYGGQTVVSATNVEKEDLIRWCVVGKWTTGIGLVLLGAGAGFTCGATALLYGAIAGATTALC
jgi:hypothetical protein